MTPSCGPCNSDCNQGRACPARVSSPAHAPVTQPLAQRMQRYRTVCIDVLARLQASASALGTAGHGIRRSPEQSRGGA